jgi:hypothetical protein
MTVSQSIVKKAKSALCGASSVFFDTVNGGLAIFKGLFMLKKCCSCKEMKDISLFYFANKKQEKPP